MTPRRVLVIGSGPILIGQAAEFDYAGVQACLALREEGVETILVNSNPATVMTDPDVGGTVIIGPLTLENVTRVIEEHRPEALLPTLGGQTGLNLAVALDDAGVLDRCGVRVLGTPLDAVRAAEDRGGFRALVTGIGEPVPESAVVESVEDGMRFVEMLGASVVVRPAFTLGGGGGGFAHTRFEARERIATGLAASPIQQVLVERSLLGWYEIEFEVLRDASDTTIAICGMENLDPMGVHTGDSIVVAPIQTLPDPVVQRLRRCALKIVRALKLEGGCNVQLAVSPDGSDYRVIEVNPRVSRSSALASKATGYPIARIAALIALGKRLHELPNPATGGNSAAFEPAVDYVVVKLPRWPFDKFPSADRSLGVQMKATGEAMAIDREFGSALLKAIRSLEPRGRGWLWEDSEWALADGAPADLEAFLAPSDTRLWRMVGLLRHGHARPSEIAAATGISPWFTDRLAELIEAESRVVGAPLIDAKRVGFGDADVAALSGVPPAAIRRARVRAGIGPAYRRVDTCAGEFPAETPYFYSSYAEPEVRPPAERRSVIVVGSGPIRIGQGIEFDYCSVRAAWAIREMGLDAVVINNNPETVSTDYDACTRLYFEPLDTESVLDVIDHERALTGTPPAVVLTFGGQTAIDLAKDLAYADVPIAG
ncbi:MAG TPA: carbamoyl-phosphate synthase large subunit, partial [Candidatus Limnocylindria bacterium]|nr:carbamoyl-phosphate synthase large subunit [Candidatus Limnocylindria bacterium]